MPTYIWKQYHINVNEMSGWTYSPTFMYVKAKSADCKLIHPSTIINADDLAVTYSGNTISSMSYKSGITPITCNFTQYQDWYQNETWGYDYVKFINPSSDWAEDEVPNPNLIYMVHGGVNDVNNPQLIVCAPVYQSSYSYSRGAYIQDVTSKSSDVYPSNGRHTDGYWYVYQGSEADPVTIQGYCTVGGVLKSLTGEGYANVGGVWKPLVRHFICNDSVWKSLFTDTGTVKLPSEYTRVEYIESTGTQWIDTGVTGSSNIGFEIDFKTHSNVGSESTDYGTIFGAFVSGNTRMSLGTWNSSTVTAGGEMCWGSKVYNPYITTGKRINISVIGTTLTTPNSTQTISGSFTSGCNIWLFCRNNNGTADQFSKTRLYLMKMYEGDELIREFVPCLNPSGVAGLWDKVNGKFYENKGTGSFVTNPVGYTDITPIMTSNTSPSGYVASASSVNGNLPAWHVFDDRLTTTSNNYIWHSAANMPQWVMLQFPEAVKVDMFSIRNHPNVGNSALLSITAFQLQGSNNGTSFDTLGTYTSDGAIGATYQYTVQSSGKYKYYRVYITAAGYVFGTTQYALVDQIRFYQSNS